MEGLRLFRLEYEAFHATLATIFVFLVLVVLLFGCPLLLLLLSVLMDVFHLAVDKVENLRVAVIDDVAEVALHLATILLLRNGTRLRKAL